MEKAPEGPLPVVTFFQPRDYDGLMLFSQQNSGNAPLKKFIPKSHLAKVIIQDNISAQRLQEMKKQQIEDRKKKAEHLFDQMKRKFLQNQQKKTIQWKKEHNYYQKMLEEIDQRKMMRELGSAYTLENNLTSSAKLSEKSSRPRLPESRWGNGIRWDI